MSVNLDSVREEGRFTMGECKHEWEEKTARGHTYVTCRRCHVFPMTHLSALRRIAALESDMREIRTLAQAENLIAIRVVASDALKSST